MTMTTRRRPRRNDWGNWQRKEITRERIHEIAGHFRGGATVKGAARASGVPAGILRRWLGAGEQNITDLYDSEKDILPEPEGHLFEACEQARGEFVGELTQKLREAGAGKESSPGSAGWLLERLESDEFGLASKLEISGQDGAPIMLEGKAVVGLADVISLARELGSGHLFGLDAGDSQRALSAAPNLLPDPSEPLGSAESPPDVQGS